MRGGDYRSEGLFSYVSCEARVPANHPLRAIRAIVDEALEVMSADFDAMYSRIGRPSIPPEKLLRALLLQAFYTIRSERQLMEQMDYNLLFRWFAGLAMDAPIWDVTGYGGATKPEILAPGGKHHVRLAPHGDHHRLHPLGLNAGAFGGIAVAAPPSATSLGPNVVARSVGTSVAAALTTGVATRAHEALEAAYPDFGGLPSVQRAALLKALLVHGARWTQARDLLVEILGPADNRQHYRQKDNVRRYLGFGAYDPELVINCAEDRATLWAVGTLNADKGRRFRIPWPAIMSGKAIPHGLRATLAWFSPPRPGAVAYRAVRMKIVEPQQLGAAGIKAPGSQPDPKQAHKGTVVHRHWGGEKAAAIAGDGFFEIDVQREADDLDHAVSFALVVTLEMAGQAEVYTQILNRVPIKPLVPIPA